MTRSLFALALILSTITPAHAASNLRTVARFVPAKGLISDAALLPDGHVILAYPEGSHLADYAPEGKLTRHILRENGLGVPFNPTMVIAGREDGLFVFDEAEHHVFRVQDDGNFSKGIDLAVIDDNTPIAAARVGSLSLAGDGSLWAVLTDRELLAHFDAKGKQLGALDLPQLLGGSGMYVRAQVTSDGTLYLLDIAQGAIYARAPGRADIPVGQPEAGKNASPTAPPAKFKRIRIDDDTHGFEAIPSIQDFAVLDDGTILAATTDAQRPLMLLSPGSGGRTSKPVPLQLGDARQLSVRASRGSFIVWASDSPVVFVLSPQ